MNKQDVNNQPAASAFYAMKGAFSPIAQNSVSLLGFDDYLVTPLDAARAMNNGMKSNTCSYLPIFWNWHEALDVNKSAIMDFGLRNVHLVETTADGTFLMNHVGSKRDGPYKLLKCYRLPPPIVEIPPLPPQVLDHLSVWFPR